MTNQQAFDAVWEYFIVRQQPPGLDDRFRCRYRTPTGCRCAAGVLIPDDRYHPDMESASLNLIRVQLLDLLGDCDLGLLEQLQAGHDNAAVNYREMFATAMQGELLETAARYGLQVPAARAHGEGK